MHTKEELKRDIKKIGIKGTDTLLVHSSMKAIGQVKGGADTVLDALIECLKDGLLIFPTHSWERINENNPVFDPLTEPSCVGILSNLFLQRKGVIRSWHPTHSVAAVGDDSQEYTSGEEKTRSPCPKEGCWGKLYDRKAKILFLGCSTKKNTYIHGVEEWNNIQNRLSNKAIHFKIKSPDGRLIDCPQFTHCAPVEDISVNYDKILKPLLDKNATSRGKIGDADTYLCDARQMTDITRSLLMKNTNLFLDDKPVPIEWY